MANDPIIQQEFLAKLVMQRRELILARANGLRSLTDQNGERVEYKTDAEMAAAIKSIDALLTPARPAHTIKFQTSKGL